MWEYNFSSIIMSLPLCRPHQQHMHCKPRRGARALHKSALAAFLQMLQGVLWAAPVSGCACGVLG